MLCGAAPEARRPVALIPIGDDAVARSLPLAEELRASACGSTLAIAAISIVG